MKIIEVMQCMDSTLYIIDIITHSLRKPTHPFPLLVVWTSSVYSVLAECLQTFCSSKHSSLKSNKKISWYFLHNYFHFDMVSILSHSLKILTKVILNIPGLFLRKNDLKQSWYSTVYPVLCNMNKERKNSRKKDFRILYFKI